MEVLDNVLVICYQDTLPNLLIIGFVSFFIWDVAQYKAIKDIYMLQALTFLI